MKQLFLFTALIGSQLLYSQCNPSTEKMMVLGDSWAFFSWSGNSYNENLDRYGFSDVSCFSNATFAVNGAEAGDYFTDPVRIQALHDYISTNPDLQFVHFSLGGNDAMASWNINMTPAEESDLLGTILVDMKKGIDTILSFNPELTILISGYDFPNFSETVGTLSPPLQQLHPFYNTWNSMGQPNASQINNLLLDATNRFIDSAAVWDNVHFVNNLGLMQYTFGQTTALTVPPYGTYPPMTTSVPGGLLDYPSPLDALNFGGLDAFHLNDDAYEIFIGRHFREFYWNQLREAHQTLYANDTASNGWLTASTLGSDKLKVGNEAAEETVSILHFNTSVLSDLYPIQKMTLFIEADSIQGIDLSPEQITLSVKSGYFGTTENIELADFTDSGNSTVAACTYGTIEAPGYWLRIEIPQSMYQFVSLTGTTQFKLAYTIAETDRFLEFSNASNNIMLDVQYAQNPFASISAIDKVSAITLFPNPAKDVVHINSASPVKSFAVYDFSGRTILFNENADTQFDVSNWPKGIYIVEVLLDNGNREMTKLIRD